MQRKKERKKGKRGKNEVDKHDAKKRGGWKAPLTDGRGERAPLEAEMEEIQPIYDAPFRKITAFSSLGVSSSNGFQILLRETQALLFKGRDL